MIVSKAQYANSNDDGCNLSFGRKGSDSGEYGSGKSYSMGRKGAVAVKFQEKGKKQYMKKLEVENTAKDHLGGIKEAFNTADGRKSSAVKKIQTEIMDGKSASSLLKGPKKKSRKSLFGGKQMSSSYYFLYLFCPPFPSNIFHFFFFTLKKYLICFTPWDVIIF